MKTKSSIYGYNGGVSNSNRYVPPPTVPLNARPPSASTKIKNDSTLYGQYGGTSRSSYYEPGTTPLSSVFGNVSRAAPSEQAYVKYGGVLKSNFYSPPPSLPVVPSSIFDPTAVTNSEFYGQYGGISNSNYYEPAISSPVALLTGSSGSAPGGSGRLPLSATKLYITQADRLTLAELITRTQWFAEHKDSILLRMNTLHLSATNTDSFLMNTAGRPEDVITYTSTTDVININVIDGGEF